MNHRQRTLACLNYEPYDRLPIVHFGFWQETLEKWRDEGHLSSYEAAHPDVAAQKIGFDFEWSASYSPNCGLAPAFETKIIEELPDGMKKVINADGVVILQRDGATSIPAEIDHLLKGRDDWEKHYLQRLQFNPFRVPRLDRAAIDQSDYPQGLYCGSLFGIIRNWLGITGSAYLYADDERLFDEIINTVGELCYKCVERALAYGAHFDFAHFWEDICFRGGPLINPQVFREKVGPHYRRITNLLNRHGISIISLDCDGMIDALIPIWLENGVNTMFPIEVGTWLASIEPWRAQYGVSLRGVGGVDKKIFAKDRASIDAEIERLKPLVDLGGYIPCPDHRIPLDAKWDNVVYYCERMRETFCKGLPLNTPEALGIKS